MSIGTLSQFARSKRPYQLNNYREHWIKQGASNKDKPDPAWQAIGMLQERICNLWDGITDMDNNRSPLENLVQHKERLSSQALKGIEQIEKTKGHTYKAVQRRLDELNTEMSKRIGLNDNGEAGKELRSVLRQMTPKDRRAALTDAVKNCDGELLSAIANGHPVASGLKDMRDIERYIDTAKSTHCADLLNEQSWLHKAVDHVEESFQVSKRFAEYAGPTPMERKQIAKAQEAAQRLNDNLQFARPNPEPEPEPEPPQE